MQGGEKHKGKDHRTSACFGAAKKRMWQLLQFFTPAQWEPIRQTRSDNNYKIHFRLPPHKLGGSQLREVCFVQGVLVFRDRRKSSFVLEVELAKCWWNISVLGAGCFCRVECWVLEPTPQRRKLWSLHHLAAMLCALCVTHTLYPHILSTLNRLCRISWQRAPIEWSLVISVDPHHRHRQPPLFHPILCPSI